MIFNSLEFALFLPVVFIIYWLLQKKLVWQNTFILMASYIFYGWWDYRFLLLIGASSLIDFLVGHKLAATEDKDRRKILLSVSLLSNLGLLGFFKYYNFFIDSFVQSFTFFGSELQGSSLDIILPVGISFYTFQTLSYTIDIYKKRLKPAKNIIEFFAFVSFFPQLVAGPIERAIHLLPQFSRIRSFDYTFAVSGLQLMLWGFFKKIVIADRLAVFVDLVFDNPQEAFGLSVVFGVVFFALQIYCDFSAYSDIAIGTGRLFGFDLMHNFKTPYFSTSMKEFWGRWHISLSTWFRDYLYIPLGGNRVKSLLWVRNMMITFIISGLWHGANFNFIIWGFIHGFVIVMEGLITKWVKGRFLLPSPIRWAITFSLVCLGWVFFRAATLGDALLLLNNLSLGLESQLQHPLSVLAAIYPTDYDIAVLFSSIAILLLVDAFIGQHDLSTILSRVPRSVRYAAYYSLAAWLLFMGVYNLKPSFIYFQF